LTLRWVVGYYLESDLGAFGVTGSWSLAAAAARDALDTSAVIWSTARAQRTYKSTRRLARMKAPRLVMVAGVLTFAAEAAASSGGTNRAMR
jgi:hypothetical protein